MTDTELLTWFENVKAQCWCDKVWGDDGTVKSWKWTCSASRQHLGKYPVQPSRPTLREAILAAHTEYGN